MILVTGGTGLVGSHLLFNLCAKEDKIKAIKRTSSDVNAVMRVFSFYSTNPKALFDKIEWVEADLLDYFEIENAFEDVDYVYHCAAFVSFNPNDKQQLLSYNVQSTANVVNLCLEKNIRKLCHVSSVASLGKTPENNIISEQNDWVDSPENSNYSQSKYLSELEVWRGIEEGLNAVIINPSIILGPGDWTRGSSTIFKKIADGMPFYTDGKNGFVDVRDVATIMIALMESTINSQRFILNAENVSFKVLFDEISNHLNKKKPQINISSNLMALAWRISLFISFISRTKPFITKESAASSLKKNEYDNKRIRDTLNYNFISISQSCKDTCNHFLSENTI